MKKLIILIMIFFHAAVSMSQDITVEPIRQLGYGTLHAIAYSPDGQYVLSAGGGGAYLWDISTGEVVRKFERHTNRITETAFSPDGSKVVTAGGMEVKVWDVANGDLLQTFDHSFLLAGLDPSYSIAAFTPDGSQLIMACNYRIQGSGTRINFLKLWDVNTGDLLKDFNYPMSQSMGRAVMWPDGSRVLTWGGADTGGIVWDIATGEQLDILRISPDGAWGLAISPDGSQIATGNSAGVNLWDSMTGEHLVEISGIRGTIASLAFSPDGNQLAISNRARTREGTVMVWDLMTGREIVTYKGHQEEVEPGLYEPFEMTAAFSPDGTKIASAPLGRETVQL